MDPDDIVQEEYEKIFNESEDLPINEDVLKQQVAARQLGYGDDELEIIERTAFKEIMDDMDAKGINYSDVDIYSYIPEEERLTPYLIFMEDVRNKWYTDEFVDYLVKVSAAGAFETIGYNDLPFSPAAQIHEHALNISFRRGPEQFNDMLLTAIDADNPIGGLNPKKMKIKYINNIFPEGSYKATLEEENRKFWEDKGMTPKGEWLPEVAEQGIIRIVDSDGNVTYENFKGEPIPADDPRLEQYKFDDMIAPMEAEAYNNAEGPEKWKMMLDKDIITEYQYQELLKGNDPFTPEGTDTPTNVVDDISPVLKGREGLPITAEEDRMLEIRWAENWSANGQGWGQQVHGTYTSEVVDGFYQFKADNPDIPNWWFPSDFINGQELTQRAFVGWGVTQEDIDDLKEGFEKGIFDKEKNKKLLKVVNDLDGSNQLIKAPDTPTNVVDDVPFTDDDIAEITNDYVKNNWGKQKTTADGVVMRINDNNELEVLVIKRKRGPHRGDWALPGGIQDDKTMQLFAEAELRWNNGTNDMTKSNDYIFGNLKGDVTAGINVDKVALTTEFTALKELYEEVGLDTKEVLTTNKPLTPKYNRFDWDARATKGVVVGGSFVFVHDNDWQPKAGDDALNAEWKTVKSILDGDTKLAFGHNEWITQVLENRQLIKDVGIDKVFDDNVKYIYGMTKPENTLGNYRDVMDKLKVINKNNKSNITKLIEAANKVRVTKGMEEIPLDRSNIQGSAESVIKNMRLGYGDPAQIQRYMQPNNFLNRVTSNYQINFNTSVADYNGEELLEQINDTYSRLNPDDPTIFTMEDLINGNEKLVGLEYKGLEVNLSEQGIDNVARQMQEKMLQNVEERMVYLHRLGFEDDVILDELRTIYKEKIDTAEFVDYLKDLIKDSQDSLQRPVTSQIKSGLRGLELTYSNQRNIFDVLEVDTQKTVMKYLETDKQLNFLDDVFGNEFMTMEPVEFWSKYGGITDRSLDQKSTYVKDGVLYFQTNHGTPGPNENVLNFIKTVENKYKDETSIQSIAQELKADRPIFFDETLKFVDPTIGRTGLIGPVLYTTTNPFIGAGYAKHSNDSMTPDTINYLIEEDLHRFFREFRDTNPEILEDVVNIAKENGILIDVIRNSDGSISDLRSVANIDQYKSLSTANIANIQGSVNEENVLKVNQSTLPGQGDIKLQNFWRQVLDEFDENWFVKDLQNGTRFIKGMPYGEFRDYNALEPKLRDELIPYVALQKTRVVPGAVNKANLESYFNNKRKFDPDFIPNFGFILGTGGILPNLLSDLQQSDENWNYLIQQINKNAPVIGFEDQQSYRYVADILDNNHQYFNITLSADLQIVSDYIKASLAIDDKDYVTAAKYLGLEFLDGDWTPIADQINETLKNNIDVYFTNSLQSKNIRKVGSSIYKIEKDLKNLLRPEDVTEWDNNFKNKTRIEKFNNFYKANNLPSIVTPENANAFIETVQSYDLTNTTAGWDKLKVDQKIYTMAGNNGYEIVLSTGGGRVDTMPHWVIGIIDPSNKLQTNQPKTLDVEIKNWAFLTEDDAEIFYELGRKNVDDLTDADLQLMSKYINPDNLVDINVSEEQLINFDKINKEKGIFWNDMIGKMENASTENLSVKIMVNQLELQNLHIAHQLGQVPKEAVAASANNLAVLLAQAPENVKAKFYTGAVNTLGILNQYGKPAVKNTLKYGGKAADKFDKWVLGPAAIDILASRMSGPGSQYETIGGALADTISRYEDETSDSVIEMLYGNKNNPEAKNLAGINIAYPVTQGIEFGKDKFKEYVYDNNVFGIKSILNFIKPKAIEALKTVTDKAGLNDWVYNVKRDMIVEMIMKENNIPYTKTNIDLYTKNYEEQNPREVDKFGNELPDDYDYSWASSIPNNYLARDFRVDERIRTGDRYAGAGGGSGQKKE